MVSFSVFVSGVVVVSFSIFMSWVVILSSVVEDISFFSPQAHRDRLITSTKRIDTTFFIIFLLSSAIAITDIGKYDYTPYSVIMSSKEGADNCDFV